MFIFKALELMKEFGNSKFAGAIVILLGEVIFTGLPEKLDELMVTDIYLAMKSDTPWYKKMIYIFLMPTNYTPIGLLWYAMYCFTKFFEMLPVNLG